MNAETLHRAATRLSGAARAIGGTGVQVRAEAARALGADSWLGAAAQAAARAHHRQATDAERVAAALQHSARALDTLTAAATHAGRQRSQVLHLVTRYGWRLDPGGLHPARLGQVPVFGTDLPGRWDGIGRAEQAADAAAALALRAVAAGLRRLRLRPGAIALAGTVAPAQAVTLARLGVLAMADVPPAVAAAELRRLLQQGDPVAIRAHLLGLPTTSRGALVAGYPGLVGPADGVPPEMRYAANRLLLNRALGTARRAGDAALAGRITGWLRAGRQILLFDLAGGRIAEVFGDLATATHVAVVVPGMLNDLTNFDALAGEARNLHRQADHLAPGAVATVAWLGYRTPGWLDAPFDDKAVAATRRLADLVGGLVLRSGVTTTVVAHSYGSMLAGRALRAGLRVDAVVALGSPGMTTATVAGLHASPGTRIYAARAPGDPVSWSENFGRDPSDPRFGAVRIATHSRGSTGPVWHTSYLTGQSECTRNLARIVTGQYAAVTALPASRGEHLTGPMDALRSVGDLSATGSLALGGAVAHLLPGPVRAPAEDAVEAAQRFQHLGQRLTDPDLPADALDTR